jgi:chorismate--pyruvate lyase
LFDKGSLTQRLIEASHGDFRVQVLEQGWGTPRLSEANLLHLRRREQAIIREVTLLCHDRPWVFARSVIPASSIRGPLRHLRHWADSSLGALLFNDPSMHRDPFQVTLLKPGNGFVPDALQGDASVWGRRSRFFLQGLPLLVCEIFLPEFKASPIVSRNPL